MTHLKWGGYVPCSRGMMTCMYATGWVCAQVWHVFRRGHEQLAASGEEPPLGGFSERVGLAEAEMGPGWRFQPNSILAVGIRGIPTALKGKVP